jgi:hypothetical protein
MKKVIAELNFGVPIGNLQPICKEKQWEAITISQNGEPDGVVKFPWWLVGLGAVAAVAIRTRNIMKKEKRY